MPGLYFDPTWLHVREKYRLLSRAYRGCVLSTVPTRELRHLRYGSFELYGLYLPRLLGRSPAAQALAYALFVLGRSLALHARHGRFDIVIAYDAFKTGLLALLISRLTGARLVVDVLGNHARSFTLNTERVGVAWRIKHRIAMRVTPFVLNRAHGVKLLYDQQLEPFSRLRPSGTYVCFHDFAPVSLFREGKGARRYILFLGSPWFLKGVDVLIRAFRQIADEFPDCTLRICGYTPDRSRFERLAAGHPRIEMRGPVPYEDVITLMAECALFVLPSRTEAMGRVLLEAMASRKPIVASNVDGIPTYVKDGYNGLLVEPESVDDLADKMRRLLSDDRLSARLAGNGYRYVRAHLSEEVYLARFSAMVERVLAR